MTFDRKPDLDNANVGKPDSRRLLKCRLYWSYQIGNSFFVQIKEFGGKGYGNSERKDLDIAGQNLAAFLEESGYKPVRIVVEINEEIIPRETYADITFNDGDCVEVVSFMGGGAL